MVYGALYQENETLLKMQAGDAEAFKILYLRYYQRLYLHAYNKLRDREVAKDIIHDLFASIWEKRKDLHITSGLSSYLYNAVRNRVIDHISKQQYNSVYIQSLSTFLEQPEGSTDHLIREQQLKELIELEIAKLSPQVKRVFELSRKEHLSHKEIASRLDLSEQTVRDYVKSALRILRMRLGIILLVAISNWLR